MLWKQSQQLWKSSQLKEVLTKVEGLRNNSVNCKRKCRMSESSGSRWCLQECSRSKRTPLHCQPSFCIRCRGVSYLRITGNKSITWCACSCRAIGDKVNVLFVASKTKDVHGNVIKELAPIVDGRGGGKPDMAMAGGSNQAKIQELLDASSKL